MENPGIDGTYSSFGIIEKVVEQQPQLSVFRWGLALDIFSFRAPAFLTKTSVSPAGQIGWDLLLPHTP